ncbi:MAG: hypothetical protein ACYCOU_25205 [Sulfobacillus sp.]
MCKSATTTAVSLMQAIEPSVVSILTLENLTNTPQGLAAMAAYKAALVALQGWKSGTTAQNVLQLIGDFQTVFNTLPLPPADAALANIILAGVEAVIGVITANSPAPVTSVPVAAVATEEESTAMYQMQVAKDTEAKVMALVPDFKRSIWHSPASQYTKTWNEAVAAGGFPPSLHI